MIKKFLAGIAIAGMAMVAPESAIAQVAPECFRGELWSYNPRERICISDEEAGLIGHLETEQVNIMTFFNRKGLLRVLVYDKLLEQGTSVEVVDSHVISSPETNWRMISRFERERSKLLTETQEYLRRK